VRPDSTPIPKPEPGVLASLGPKTPVEAELTTLGNALGLFCPPGTDPPGHPKTAKTAAERRRLPQLDTQETNMTNQPYLTTGDIARIADIPLHKVTYAIQVMQIPEDTRAGNFRLFRRERLQELLGSLAAVDKPRKPGRKPS
jgi:hypothetical protein